MGRRWRWALGREGVWAGPQEGEGKGGWGGRSGEGGEGWGG